MIYIVPVFILANIIYGAIKKVPLYDKFAEGASSGVKLMITVFPYLVSIFVMLELFRISGLQQIITDAISPLINTFGIPSELTEFILLRPLTGSGSLAMIENIIKIYGADSYPARAASVIMGSTETVFYVTAIYFSTVKVKKLGAIIPISLLASLLSAILACIVCRVI